MGGSTHMSVYYEVEGISHLKITKIIKLRSYYEREKLPIDVIPFHITINLEDDRNNSLIQYK